MSDPYNNPVTVEKAWAVGSQKPWAWDLRDLAGDPVDASGYTLLLVIEQDGLPPGSADVLTKDSASGDFSITDIPGEATGNNARIVMDGWEVTDTTGLDPNQRYRYALWRTAPEPVDILAYGQAILLRLPREDA